MIYVFQKTIFDTIIIFSTPEPNKTDWFTSVKGNMFFQIYNPKNTISVIYGKTEELLIANNKLAVSDFEVFSKQGIINKIFKDLK